MGRRTLFVAVLVAVASSGLAACQDSQPFETRTGDVTWHDCVDILCSSLSVPLDPAHPEGRKIDLALGRIPATGERQGAVLANPGGPGAAGLDFLQFADELFTPAIREHYDIISWDPRGAGKSSPVECATNLDAFYAVDRSPDNDAELDDNVASAQSLADGCERESAELLPFLSTRYTVRDMDAIRAAIGEEQVTYVGFSYGTFLGALYAEQYPERVRAMVLDGALDPSLSAAEITATQAVGFDESLEAFFDWCRSHDDDCGFASGGNPADAYARVIAGIDAEPLPAEVAGEDRVLGPGEADLGVAEALYSGSAGWPTLGSALALAAQGNGAALLQLSDSYTERQPGGKYGNLTFAFYATSCVDMPPPATLEEVEQLATTTAAEAPNFGATTTWLGLACTYWPVPADRKPAPVNASGAPPIVVIGTTNDPATPLSGAVALAEQLPDGRLLVYEGEGHTAYGRSECVDDAVDEYLLTLTPPDDGTRCS